MCRRSSVLILSLGLASPLSAQRLERSHIEVRSQEAGSESVTRVLTNVAAVARSDSVDRVAPMLLSGILLGGAGLFAGGSLGYALETSNGCADDLFCGLAGAILGGLVGESIGMAAGIHLAGGQRNSFAGDLGVALGIGALGLVAAPMTNGVSLLVIPIAQLAIGTQREVKAHR